MRNTYNIEILPKSNDFVMPKKGSDHAIAYDLHSTIDVVLNPDEGVVIPSGFALSMPPGVGAWIIPRSGLGIKHGLVIKNGTGLIDPDYRGEVGIALVNRGDRYVTIKKGDRVAQMYFAEVPETELVPVTSLEESVRGSGGFGSTGGFQV